MLTPVLTPVPIPIPNPDTQTSRFHAATQHRQNPLILLSKCSLQLSLERRRGQSCESPLQSTDRPIS
jgi:hypothetical protein